MQHKLILGVATAALLGASAMAQETKPHGDKPTPASAQTTAAPAPVKAGGPCHKASDVIGTKVVNAQNVQVGKIEDLVVDPTSGRIDFAVLSITAKSAKDQWHAVPFSSLSARPFKMEGDDAKKDDAKKTGRCEFVLNVPAATLESAPGFPKDKWPDVSAPGWRSDLERHYGIKHAGTSITNGDVIANVNAVRASKLLDRDLVTTGQEKIGDIEELAIDTTNSRVAFVVVSSGGFLGIGDKLHAIPWAAVHASPSTGMESSEKLVVDVSRERLQKSPEFKKDEWVRMGEPAWMNELYGYYRVSPYWSPSGNPGVRDAAPMPPKGKDARKDGDDPR